jgi:hypothetical protein
MIDSSSVRVHQHAAHFQAEATQNTSDARLDIQELRLQLLARHQERPHLLGIQ